MTSTWNLGEGDELATGLTAIKLLGGGHAYEAYLAWDERLFAPVVVKVVRPDQVDDADTLRTLEREVGTVGALNHPVIVRGFHAVLDGSRPHLVLENIDGPRLSTLLRRHGPLALEQLLPLGLEICSGLHYLRARGMVHLDIKPSNIIMGAPPRLIDLSIARTVEAAARLRYAVGTDDYMAPEQCAPPATGVPGPPADIWGLGATLFEALAGYRPYERGVPENDAPLTHRFPQLRGELAMLPRRTPDPVAKPILACLAYDPADRPTPAELAEMLQPLVEALPKPKLSSFKPRL
ncbi:MAG: protein kinase [Propionibacteriales bacterium]|nr:protein kinase [Propionibacteriales bacterium]